jgi:hypothetical protein
MTSAFILDFEGGTAEQYDQVVALMDLNGRTAPGGLFHAAGETATGWRVCDVWETAEHFQAFAQEKIGPLSAAVGLPAPTIRSFEVDGVRTGPPAGIRFVQVVLIEGMDRAGFDDLEVSVIPDRSAPPGCVYHVHGQLSDAYCVVDAWTDRATRDRFMETRVKPAMAERGATAPPVLEDLDVTRTLTPVQAGATV